ncbi:MAG: hypothetical protein FWE82_03830 [Defluviitaleaceae bacterium]|nr:hypothetical protein [Defluviitaleaceae bacterium]
MDETEIKLNILTDCLRKKENAMVQIAALTEKQKDVLTTDKNNNRFHLYNDEKQSHIKTVIECDEAFESLLKEIGPALDSDPSKYGEKIKILQEMIRRVMDLDVKIRVSEDENGNLIIKQKQPPPPSKTKIKTTSDAQVIDAYVRNKKNPKN